MWHVRQGNESGNWGSNDSDTRCITSRRDGSPYHWILELSSFTMAHVLKHHGPGRSPYNCALCSKALGRPLPSTCMRHVVWKNVGPLVVPCACVASELAGVRSVELLLVDAEGHDDEAIATFPFFSHPPKRIIFEAKHMPRWRFDALAERLRAAGYECIEAQRNASRPCPHSAGAAAWHLRSDGPGAGAGRARALDI